MYMCVYIYPVRNPETVYQNKPVPEYLVPIVNPKQSPEWNSKP